MLNWLTAECNLEAATRLCQLHALMLKCNYCSTGMTRECPAVGNSF